MFVEKVINSFVPPYLSDILMPQKPNKALDLWGDGAFAVIAPKRQKKLPPDICKSTNPELLKSKFKTYLFRKNNT